MKRLIPLAVLIVIGLAYTGYRIYQSRQPYEWSGTVEARTISIGSRVGGRVKEIKAREGDRVEAGQVLLVLEPGDLEAQLLQAAGQLEQARANQEKLEKGSRPEEIQQARARAMTATAALEESRAGSRQEEIGVAQARLATAEATADKAKIDVDRFHKLGASGAASQADVDAADTRLREAIGQRDAARETLAELKNGVRSEEVKQAEARALEAQASARLVQAGSRVEDISAARGQVMAAQGKVDQIKNSIDELQIRAPRAARVESLDLRPGDIISPASTAATLLEEDQLYVRIYVPETLIGHLKISAEVPVTVDSFPDRTFKGVVEHINVVGEYSPRNLQTADERADQVFAARVGLRDGRDDLRAGMAAFITVPR